MRLKLTYAEGVWNVVKTDGEIVWSHPSWIACVGFLRGCEAK